jgi:hypothetical protein
VCIRRMIPAAGRPGGVNLGISRLWRSKAKPGASVAILPDIYSPASDERYRGGYLITEDPEAPVMILTDHLAQRPG